MKQSDPRYQLVLDQTYEMINHRFDMIPSILFRDCLSANNTLEPSDILELVGSHERECINCGEEVEKGDLDPEYENAHKWTCICESTHITENVQYEELPFVGPRFSCWPAAHDYVFWTIEWPNTIVDAATQAGFLVYESPKFDGYILAIDGGGYDFYNEHWIPLYLALGLKWHETQEGWQEALKKYADMPLPPH